MAGKKLRILLCITVTAFCLAGCQGGSTSGTSVTESVSPEKQAAKEAVDDGTITGQVTAIDGNEITLELGTMPERTGDFEGERPTGDRPDGEEMSEGTPPEMPEGESGQTPPEMPEGETGDMTKGQGRMGGLQLTGEEQIITVSDSTTYTVQSMGESTEGSLEDIETDSILKVAMDGDTVTSVMIMNMNMRGGIKNNETENE